MGELCNNSNKCQLLNKSENELLFYIIDLTSVLYLKNVLVHSIVEVFKTICFDHIFTSLGSGWSFSYFKEILIFLSKKRDIRVVLCQKKVYKHPPFPAVLLLLTKLRSVIVEINSDFLLSQIFVFLDQRFYISLSFSKNYWRSLS